MEKRKKMSITIIIISIIAILVLSMILKYEVEGEKNMPFQLSKIIVIGTAKGNEKEDVDNSWILGLEQNNDFYISISKNPNKENQEIIKNVSIENLTIIKAPQKGNIAYYRPVLQDGKLQYTKQEESKIQNELIYMGATGTDIENLKVSNQGGTIRFRISNENIEQYHVNDTSEIIHNGTIFSKTQTTIEQLQFTVSFDIIIQLESDKRYKANYTIKLPNDNLIEKGITSFEKTDFEDVIFKRI